MTVIATSRTVDRLVGLAIYNAVQALAEAAGIKAQFPGIKNDFATENEKEWVAIYLLSANPINVRKHSSVRGGLIQVSCFARFHEQATEQEHDRPWVIADLIGQGLAKQSFPIHDGDVLVGAVTLMDMASVYVNENEIARTVAQFDPSNVHAVVMTYRYTVSSKLSA